FGAEYLPFLYYDKNAKVHFGFAARLLPETKESMVSLLSDWENAAIENDLASLFLGKDPGGRKASLFKTTKEQTITFREMNYKNDFSLVYAFTDNIFLMTTNPDALRQIVKYLPKQ
ncbi:MAG: hypothetical protein ACK4NX_01065, partial [Candidatus Paceibacteria bacterium]